MLASIVHFFRHYNCSVCIADEITKVIEKQNIHSFNEIKNMFNRYGRYSPKKWKEIESHIYANLTNDGW